MGRDYEKETQLRVAYLQEALRASGCTGFIFGSSGGKDSALAGILCKMACSDTVGVIMPCQSSVNFGQDRDDALALAAQYGIETRTVDLSKQKELYTQSIEGLTADAVKNIAPRLRMITLYAIAMSERRLVCGTGNLSERYMGYFTKWGDGAFDLNPIGDLLASEVFDFLRYLNAPKSIIEKAPSAGLFEGQTDEQEMGVSYAEIDRYIQTGQADARAKAIIDRYHKNSAHKRSPMNIYGSV